MSCLDFADKAVGWRDFKPIDRKTWPTKVDHLYMVRYWRQTPAGERIFFEDVATFSGSLNSAGRARWRGLHLPRGSGLSRFYLVVAWRELEQTTWRPAPPNFFGRNR